MAQAAFGRALIASGGTLLVLGGSTLVITSLGVAKHMLVTCPSCSGLKHNTCSVCDGERILKYIPGSHVLGARASSLMCACTMCEGSGDQTCVNCLGEGMVYPDKFGLLGIDEPPHAPAAVEQQ